MKQVEPSVIVRATRRREKGGKFKESLRTANEIESMMYGAIILKICTKLYQVSSPIIDRRLGQLTSKVDI